MSADRSEGSTVYLRGDVWLARLHNDYRYIKIPRDTRLAPFRITGIEQGTAVCETVTMPIYYGKKKIIIMRRQNMWLASPTPVS